ncbi:MAG: TetR/AcrR family transcriptional regulator [Polyangia bacterium]
MARKTGDRNRDYNQKREQILAALQQRLLKEDAARVSMSELAAAADVSLSSLRHHVGTRAEAIGAVLERLGRLGAPFTTSLAAPPQEPLAESLRKVMASLLLGLRMGVLEIHALGIATGLRDRSVGPAYLNQILEPTLRCVETRLGHHIDRGELPPCDVRLATLSLLSPLILSALHQSGLGGDCVRPLPLERVCDEQVERFLRAYGPVPQPQQQAPVTTPAQTTAPTQASAAPRTRSRPRGRTTRRR